MTTSSRRSRRPSHLMLVEAVLMAAVLATGSSILSPVSTSAEEPTGSIDPAPSPTASPMPDPSALLEPSPTPEPVITPEPVPTPDPVLTPDPVAPTASPTEPGPLPPPSVEPTVEPSLDPAPTATAEPSPIPSFGVSVDHVWIDTIDRRSGLDVPGAKDAPVTGAMRGAQYVVRFQVVNNSDRPIELRPTIEFAAGTGSGPWTVVPAVNPVDGTALYSSANVRRGEDPAVDPISSSALRLLTSSDPAAAAQQGLDHAGVNPGRRLTIGAHAFTELAFTVRATADAAWLATYLVRLTDDAAAIPGAGVASLTLRDSPPLLLSPGQRSGIPVPEPSPTRSLTGLAVSTWGGDVPLIAPLAGSFTTPHGPYSLTTDACAACHTAHTGQASPLLVQPDPQSAMCFTCHDGSGAESDIAAQYTDPTVPANDPDTASYYEHPATALTSGPAAGDQDAFAGILNRRSTCADCHSPHRADATLSVETAAGWTASGALIGASGVAVSNGAAGTTPSYTWTSSATLEYQVCFKCHSGFTELNAPSGGPSTWALDKAVELNPANRSYHPVEAAGTNATAQMARSLLGTSPYKLWSFTTASTIRCLNCHGDSRLANPASPPAAGGRLAPHAVPNRGMLIQPLRDRVLKSSSAAYAAADFALCYVCHGEAPFVDGSQNARLDTRFPLHGYHTTSIASFVGPGGSIDTDGAGGGNAICSECHFRTHGTTDAVDDQPAWSRLVNFAPDVQPYQGSNPAFAGELSWDVTTQTCTLTCHGVDHAGWGY